MKDEIVGIVILFLLIGFFIVNTYALESHTKNIIEKIDDAQNSEDCKIILKEWKKERKYLFYTCRDNLLTQIEENIIFGLDYMEENDIGKAKYSLKKAKLLLEDLTKREKIKLDNIF